MTHKLYYTDINVSEAQYRAGKSTLMPINYADLLDALAMARDTNARGAIAWEIESSDGTVIDRAEIVRLLKVRVAELVGRPIVR
jgi:hypothetical protein